MIPQPSMSMVIRPVYGETGTTIACHSITFPGGEPHIQLDPREVANKYLWIDARVTNASEWMRLVALIDAVRGCGPKRLGLFLPYFPGARQDRRQSGTAFTARVYADQLSLLGMDKIVVLDPHSDVLSALLSSESIPLAAPVMRCDGVICPDAGAERRADTAAKDLGVGVTHGRKHRDSATGKLSGFSCDPLPKVGRYLIVDDICDGGGTFIGLMQAIERDPHYAGSEFSLYVSHGIFSKGLDDLLRHFVSVYTTDSWPQEAHATHIESGRLKVRDLLPDAVGIMHRSIAQ